jgi:hypothetical protein
VKSTGLLFLLSIGMAVANPASALDFVMGPDGTVSDSAGAIPRQDPAAEARAAPPPFHASSNIPWEPRWTSDTDAPETATAGGAPTPIVPAAYTAAIGRPATLR